MQFWRLTLNGDGFIDCFMGLLALPGDRLYDVVVAIICRGFSMVHYDVYMGLVPALVNNFPYYCTF